VIWKDSIEISIKAVMSIKRHTVYVYFYDICDSIICLEVKRKEKEEISTIEYCKFVLFQEFFLTVKDVVRHIPCDGYEAWRKWASEEFKLNTK